MKNILNAFLLLAAAAALYGCKPDSPTTQAESSPAPVMASQSAAAPAEQPVAAKQEAKPGAALPDAEIRTLAQISGCFTCHKIDKKLIGPAWKDVAAKYRGQNDAEAMLIAKVAKGSSGVWGSMPMPPNAPRIKDNDIKMLVRFILSLK